MVNCGKATFSRSIEMLRTQYGLYQESVFLSRLNSKSYQEKWDKATFWVFDAPDSNLPFEVTILQVISNAVFKGRIEYLKDCEEKGKFPSFVKLIDTVLCEGEKWTLPW
jgi:hypothetical protein